MPPTLISGIFGMNVKLPLVDKGVSDFIIIMVIMLMTVIAASYLFKKHDK